MARRKKGSKRVEKAKQKKTYRIVAPQMFESKVIGETIATKPENVLLRVVPVALSDLQEGKVDPSTLYTTVKLRVVSVGEDTVNTDFAGHTTAFSYLRSLARRRRSVLHDVIDVTTKDGKRLRLKTMLVTFRKVSSVVRRNLRHALVEEVTKKAAKMNYADLIKDVLYGKFSKDVAKEVNKITPVTHLLVKKSEVEENLKEVVQ